MAYNGFFGSPVAFPVRPSYPHSYFPGGAPMIFTGGYTNPYSQSAPYPPYILPPVYKEGPYPPVYQQPMPPGPYPKPNDFYYVATQRISYQSFG